MSKKKIVMKFEFDDARLKTAFRQIMKEGQEPMALHLKQVMGFAGIESDPAIHIKEDLIVFKMSSTDKGFIFAYEDLEQKKLVAKQYKLLADNEVYMTFAGGSLLVWFKRNNSPDVNVENMVAFDNVNSAVDLLKEIDDPLVVAERIKQRDIEDGILDKDGNPIMKVEKEPKLEDAVPSVKK